MFTSTRTSVILSLVPLAPAATAVFAVCSASRTGPAIASQSVVTDAPNPYIPLIANPCQLTLGIGSRPASA